MTNVDHIYQIQGLGRKVPVVWAMLVFSWIWSLVLSLPPLLGWGSFKPGKKYFRNLENYLICTVLYKTNWILVTIY